MKSTCKNCRCATCVFNPDYATNTPKPCFDRDCDICEDGDMECTLCSRCMTIEQVNNKMKNRG